MTYHFESRAGYLKSGKYVNIYFNMKITFLVSSGGGGGGGLDVMNLVYGSSSSSYMDCEVH